MFSNTTNNGGIFSFEFRSQNSEFRILNMYLGYFAIYQKTHHDLKK